MQQETLEGGGTDARVDVLLPDSHDWTTLGTGGGVETFLTMLFRRAADVNLSIAVLSPGPYEETVGAVHFFPIMKRASRELAFTRQLRRVLTNGHIKIPRGGVVLANAEHYAWAFRGIDVPIVLMSHGALPETLQMRHSAVFVRLFRLIVERHAVHRAAKVVAVSPEVRLYYLSRYRKEPPGKFVVVPVGSDLQDLDARPVSNPLHRFGLPDRAKIVLFVGRLYPEKNVSLFVQTCDLLREQDDEVHAVVIGDGMERELLQERMRSRPWLHWIPKLTHSEVLDSMALSNALVICSRYESGPLVLLEALGLGTPVVSVDAGRARELIRDESGRIVADDASSLAQGVREMLQSPRSRQVSESSKRAIDFKATAESLAAILREAQQEGVPRN